MAFDLSTCMDGIATFAIAQGITTRAYGFPMPDPTPPCLVVQWPTTLDFDFTFHPSGVGSVHAVFPLWFVVGRVVDKAARDALSVIVSGATGIKDKLDGPMGGTLQATARVINLKIGPTVIAGVDYLAAEFELDVIA